MTAAPGAGEGRSPPGGRSEPVILGLLARRRDRQVLLGRDAEAGLVVVKRALPGARLPGPGPTPGIRHPNVATVLRASPVEVVAEYVEGPDLRSCFGHLPGPGVARVRAAASLLLGVAEGLAALHEAGIAHGDLKPENVFAAGGLVPRLTDYAQSGPRGGTLAWLAPERLDGDGPASPRADLYALGLLVHEAVGGAHPLEGSAVLDTGARADLPHRLPGACAAEPALGLLLGRLLDPEPRSRLADARVAAAALAALARGGVPAPPLAPVLAPALGEVLRCVAVSLVRPGRTAFVAGPAGSGKTRLLAETALRSGWRFEVSWSRAAGRPPARPGKRPRLLLVDEAGEAPGWSRQPLPARVAVVIAVSAASQAPPRDCVLLPGIDGEPGVEERLEGLARAPRRLLEEAAAAGGTVAPGWSAFVRASRRSVLALAAAGLAHPGPEGELAVDPPVARAVLAALGARRRRDLGRSLLARLGAEGRELERNRVLVADLAALAGEADAAERLRAATEWLREHGEAEAALGRVERLLELRPDDPDGLRGRHTLLVALGRARAAVEAATALLEVARRSGDARLAAEALRRRANGRLAGAARHAALAEQDAREGLAILPEGRTEERARLLMTLAAAAGSGGDHATALGHAKAACELLAGTEHAGLRTNCLHNLGHYARQAGRLEEAAPLIEGTAQELAEAGSARTASLAAINLGRLRLAQGRLWAARVCFRRARQALAGVGDRVGELRAQLDAVYVEAHLGIAAEDLEELETRAGEAEAERPFDAAHGHVNLARARRGAGDLPRAEQAARRARRVAAAAEHPEVEAEAVAQLALVALEAAAPAAPAYAAEALRKARTAGEPGVMAEAAWAGALAGIEAAGAVAREVRGTASAEWAPLLDLACGLLASRGALGAGAEAHLARGAAAALALAEGAGPARASFLGRRDIVSLGLELVGAATGAEHIDLAAVLLCGGPHAVLAGPLLEAARAALGGRPASAPALREALLRSRAAGLAEVARLVARLASRATKGPV